MEEITIKELNIDYYKKELQTAIKQLHEAQNEIKALESEIDDQNAMIRTLRAELEEQAGKMEQEYHICSKHEIKSVQIYFK